MIMAAINSEKASYLEDLESPMKKKNSGIKDMVIGSLFKI
jgi:hypothetical protein